MPPSPLRLPVARCVAGRCGHGTAHCVDWPVTAHLSESISQGAGNCLRRTPPLSYCALPSPVHILMSTWHLSWRLFSLSPHLQWTPGILLRPSQALHCSLPAGKGHLKWLQLGSKVQPEGSSRAHAPPYLLVYCANGSGGSSPVRRFHSSSL
jgi:hypothetical protein